MPVTPDWIEQGEGSDVLVKTKEEALMLGVALQYFSGENGPRRIERMHARRALGIVVLAPAVTLSR